MSIVIGLHGAKGSGKDYFYQVVKEKYPTKDIRKIAYADPIKHKVMFLFGLKEESEYDEFKRTLVYADLANRSISQDGRHIVREIGMMMRDYNPNQFVDYVESTIKASPNSIWCITDLRFSNELESINNTLNGCVVKIKRNGFLFDGHVTETEIDDKDCNRIIHNDSNILGEYEQNVIDTFKFIIREVK
jgi:hypothetical protein